MLFFFIVFAVFLLTDMPQLIKGGFKKEAVIYSLIAAVVAASAGIYYIFL